MSEYETAALALAQAQLVLAQTRVGIMQAQVWVAALVGLGQGSLLAWGLWMMRGAGRQRDAQLAWQAEQFAELVRRGEQQFAELVRRGERQADQQGQALSQIGQALDRQGQALDRQGETLGKIGQALDRQSQVLAALLRQRP